ncbi:MAG TPA: CoA transferase [Chloroflexota bacterium]|nr:CoA transferase [Chloroflexota bacterium]
MAKLLDGLVVLDLTRVLAGPFCTMILADLGARVIKIEPPGGDEARQFGPFVDSHSVYFANVNRGKESVVLDLKTPEGQRLARLLSERADVLIENFRPGSLTRLGLGYDDLKIKNPRLVYASVSGFGQTGPYRNRGAYDIVIQAMSGLMGITGASGGPPTRVGASIGDITPALFATIGILSALHQRSESGQGCYLDIGMLDAAVAIVENAMGRFSATGQNPEPIGNRHPTIAPFSSFETADGFVVIAAGNDGLFARLCQVVNRPDLAIDERFVTNDARTRNVDALTANLGEVLLTRSSADWLTDLERAGVPAGRVNQLSDLIGDEHLRARRMIVSIDHPGIGELLGPGNPIKARGFSDDVSNPSPRLGQHTKKVLRELAELSSAEMGRLADQGPAQ